MESESLTVRAIADIVADGRLQGMNPRQYGFYASVSLLLRKHIQDAVNRRDTLELFVTAIVQVAMAIGNKNEYSSAAKETVNILNDIRSNCFLSKTQAKEIRKSEVQSLLDRYEEIWGISIEEANRLAEMEG